MAKNFLNFCLSGEILPNLVLLKVCHLQVVGCGESP